MNGFRRKILSGFQSDLSSLIIGACRANGCLPPSHYVSRIYSTRLECSQSTGTPGTNRGPFFFMFLNTCVTIFRGSAHMKTIDPVTIVIVTIYFANHPPPPSIQDFDFSGQAIPRFNLEASVRRRREM